MSDPANRKSDGKTDSSTAKVDASASKLEDAVATRERRKLKARADGDRSVWFGLGMMGLVGWSIALPTLIGVAVGLWIDTNWPGDYSWCLMLMLAGIGVGCLNAWHWIRREGGID